MTNKNIVILGTGGTIAGTSAIANDNVGYSAAQLGIAQLVATIPEVSSQFQTSLEQVAQIDSKDMTFAIWSVLAQRASYFLQREDVGGVVITHGTDTLEETAYFLHALLQPVKPVVLTCAMRPATSLSPDGPQNLVDAIAVASHAGASGVVAVCAGSIHGALDVQKVHPYRLDAFSSGDSGAIGFVEEGRLRMLRNWPVSQAASSVIAIDKIAIWALEDSWPRVEIVLSHAGADGRMVDALAATGVEGIVIACTGNGTMHQQLEVAVARAAQSGIRIVRASRCFGGQIVGNRCDGATAFTGLSPVKARIALILELMAHHQALD